MPVLIIGENLSPKTRDIIIILLVIFIAAVLAAALAYAGASLYNLYRAHKHMKTVVKRKIWDVEARQFQQAHGKVPSPLMPSPNISLAPISYPPTAYICPRARQVASPALHAPVPVTPLNFDAIINDTGNTSDASDYSVDSVPIEVAPPVNPPANACATDSSPVVIGTSVDPINSEAAEAQPVENKDEDTVPSLPIHPVCPSDEDSLFDFPSLEYISNDLWFPAANRDSGLDVVAMVAMGADLDGIADGWVTPSRQLRLATAVDGRTVMEAAAIMGQDAQIHYPSATSIKVQADGHVKGNWNNARTFGKENARPSSISDADTSLAYYHHD
ncbi:hypothetical protein AX17_002604 [Amanita inopinata Kibby_2008]|nr:hypothetical protein AX17_002604 [Amanita inopinata Kibby_2008]